MLHQQLFVFDIETVPDPVAAAALTGCDPEDIEGARQALTDYHLKITDGRNPFPRQPFHRVVAISFLVADIHRDVDGESYSIKELRSGGDEGSSEEELVKGFFHYLSKSVPRLVTYNGRSFDLPVMKYRAMHYGVPVPFLYKNGDKWNSYTSRYSLDWHCDLLEALSDFGASARCKMNEICALLGLPGKIGVDGSDVAGMYDEGRVKEIRDYCETDVMNTYAIYLHYMRHTGALSPANFDQSIEDLKAHLKISDQPHFDEYLAEWEESGEASAKGAELKESELE